MRNIQEIRAMSERQSAGDFTRLAHLMLKYQNRPGDMHERIARERGLSERIQNVIKAPVAASTLSGTPSADWAIVSNGFTASLVNAGIFDGMLGSMKRVPMSTPNVLVSSSTITGYTVGEGQSKPISTFALGPQALEKTKVSAFVVVSDELARASGGAVEALVSAELRRAVIAATDREFLSSMVEGVTAGVSAGATAANVITDLGVALAKLSLTADSKVFVVMSPARARGLALKSSATAGTFAFEGMTLTGGQLVGAQVLVSDHLPTTGSPAVPLVVLIDASQVAADTSELQLDIARHASLEMADDPSGASAAGSPSAPVSASMVSLFQTNSAGLRLERWLAFKKLRSSAVATISAAAW